MIHACDKALEKKDQVIKTQKETINLGLKYNGELHTEVKKLEDDNNAWYHNPILMTVLGGAVASSLLFLKYGARR